MRHGVRGVMALVGGLSLASHAQDVTYEARTVVNWEYSDRLFVVRADLDEDAQTDEGAHPPMRPVSDAYWVLQPGLTAALNGRYGSLSLRYDIGRTLYQRYDELDGWRHHFGAGLTVGLGPAVDLTLRYDWLRSEQATWLAVDRALLAAEAAGAPDEAAGAPEVDEPDIRERYTDRTTAARIRYAPGDAIAVMAGATQRVREGAGELDGYTRDRGDVALDWRGAYGWNARIATAYGKGEFQRGADVRETELHVGVGRDFAQDWNWGARYRLHQLERQDEAGTPETGYRLHTPALSVAYRKPRGGGVALTGGLARRVPDDSEEPIDMRFTGRLDLARVFERGDIALELRTGHADGTYSRDRYNSAWYREVGGRSDYGITRFVRVGAFFTYRVDDYTVDRAADDEDARPAPASPYSTRMGFRLRYAPRDWLATECLYVRTDRYSLALDERYVENRVVLALSLRASYRAGAIALPSGLFPSDVP